MLKPVLPVLARVSDEFHEFGSVPKPDEQRLESCTYLADRDLSIDLASCDRRLTAVSTVFA